MDTFRIKIPPLFQIYKEKFVATILEEQEKHSTVNWDIKDDEINCLIPFITTT